MTKKKEIQTTEEMCALCEHVTTIKINVKGICSHCKATLLPCSVCFEDNNCDWSKEKGCYRFPKIETATVYSSHGEIEINKHTGEILEFSGTTEYEYGFLLCFDIQEYCEYWNEEPAEHYDILNLGAWQNDGEYDGGACEGWREDLKQLRKEEQNSPATRQSKQG